MPGTSRRLSFLGANSAPPPSALAATRRRPIAPEAVRVRVAADGIRVGGSRPHICYAPLECVRVIALISAHARTVHVHVADTTLTWITNALLGLLQQRARLTIHVHLDRLTPGDYRENGAMYAMLRAYQLRVVTPSHFVGRVLF